jgi:hypothetical protein
MYIHFEVCELLDLPETSGLNVFIHNPATDVLNFVSESEIENLIIFDARGRLIYETKPNESTLQIDIASIKPGEYYYIITLNSGRTIKSHFIKL